MPLIPIGGLIALLLGVAALVFVLPVLWSILAAAMRGDDLFEAFGEAIESTFDGLGARIGQFVGLSAVLVLLWIAWRMIIR